MQPVIKNELPLKLFKCVVRFTTSLSGFNVKPAHCKINGFSCITYCKYYIFQELKKNSSNFASIYEVHCLTFHSM